MKKLKLSDLNLRNTEVLTRKQLKKILGGSGSGSINPCSKCCWISNPDDCSDCACGVICVPGAFWEPCPDDWVECITDPNCLSPA
jgi:hypothetical protein